MAEARILDGKQVARDVREELKEEVARLKAEHDLTPGLGVILVGDDPASKSYIRGKRKACDDIGLYSVERNAPADTPQSDVISLVQTYNDDPAIHGILVQLPLPGDMDESAVLNSVLPEKDVDGLHPVNLGRLLRGEHGYLPCTPHGVQQMLVRAGIPTAGKHVVIVGRSTLVGRPLANLLSMKGEGANATVTVCHTGTSDLGHFTRQADILVVICGRPGTVTADMVKEGAVVIDVGVNQVEDASRKRGYRLVGDVDYDRVKEKASAITPVPGGVGPMTITMLLYNTVLAAKRAHGL